MPKRPQKLVALVEGETMTQSEFVSAFEKVVDLVLKLKEQNKETMTAFEELVVKVGKKLEGDHMTEMGHMKEEMARHLQDFARQFTVLKDAIDAKLAEVKDGKDADEETIVGKVIDRIKFPEPDKVILDGPPEIREKLESLDGDERLDAKAIKGLEKVIEGLTKEVTQLKNRPVAVGITGRDLFTDIDISASLDGSTKSFNIAGVWNIISVALSSYPYGSLRKNIDYTFTPTSITFTDTIDATTQLAVGQQCVITAIKA